MYRLAHTLGHGFNAFVSLVCMAVVSTVQASQDVY